MFVCVYVFVCVCEGVGWRVEEEEGYLSIVGRTHFSAAFSYTTRHENVHLDIVDLSNIIGIIIPASSFLAN